MVNKTAINYIFLTMTAPCEAERMQCAPVLYAAPMRTFSRAARGNHLKSND